jgi:hypothetical protein
MPITETVVNQTPLPLAPVDDSVHIPESVKRAAALAESFYPKAAEVAPPAAPVTAEAPAPPVTPPQSPPTEGQWEHRYLSMKGRYESSQQTNGVLQEQLQELGNELIRTQQLLSPNTQSNSPQPTAPLLTDEDRSNYGPDLLDVVQRAALEAVAPKISALEAENAKLRQSTVKTDRQRIYQFLAQSLPNWEAINTSPRFLQWLALRDVYSGGIRSQMLKTAFQAADAPRVLAFFNGFLAEEAATGNDSTGSQPQPQETAPRQAAVALETLAAPGRARPATGDSQVPVDKPTFTRKQIADFYIDVRRGVYAGRDQDKARDEQRIFAAQRDGRVR